MHRQQTLPIRYSQYAIAVPFELVERKAKRSNQQNIILFGIWMLTISLFLIFRRALVRSSASGLGDMFVDTIGRALSVSVSNSNESQPFDQRKCTAQMLLAALTLFGMLAGSMCAGVLYEQYTEPHTLVQRIQTIEDLCESDIRLQMMSWGPTYLTEDILQYNHTKLF